MNRGLFGAGIGGEDGASTRAAPEGESWGRVFGTLIYECGMVCSGCALEADLSAVALHVIAWGKRRSEVAAFCEEVGGGGRRIALEHHQPGRRRVARTAFKGHRGVS